MAGFIVFGAGSLALVVLSRSSLRAPRSHGFWRFLVLECILGLVVLNAQEWFRSPFCSRQLVSWILLLSSLILAIHGFYILRRLGEPKGSIENTTRVVRRGAYKYIRHPLYSTFLLGAWGVFLKEISLIGGLLAVLATGFAVATAKVEEAENLQRFGGEYAAYMEATRMFIPFVF